MSAWTPVQQRSTGRRFEAQVFDPDGPFWPAGVSQSTAGFFWRARSGSVWPLQPGDVLLRGDEPGADHVAAADRFAAEYDAVAPVAP